MLSYAIFTGKPPGMRAACSRGDGNLKQKIVRKTNFPPLALQGKLTVLSFRSKIVLKANICEKFWL